MPRIIDAAMQSLSPRNHSRGATLVLAGGMAFALLLSGCSSTARGPSESRIASPALLGPPEWIDSFDAAWKRIHDSHFDREFNGVDWEQVRIDYRPRAEAATTEDELRTVIKEMLGELGQSHFDLIPRELSARLDSTPDDDSDEITGEFGFDMRLIENDVVVVSVEADGPAAEAGVRPGWILHSVDGDTFDDLMEEMSDAEVNERILAVHLYRAIMAKIVGPIDEPTRLQFIDGSNQPVSLQLQAQLSDAELFQFGNLPEMELDFHSERLPSRPDGNGIGYIRFNIWMAPMGGRIGRAIDEFRDADGIIIDLRGNPGGIGAMVVRVSGFFLNNYEELGEMTTRSGTLQFRSNPQRVSPAGERVEPFSGPVAVLIDELTGSTSEIFAACMQDVKRARIFGQQSVGAALPAMTFELPNGDVLLHAVGDFVTSTGRHVEGDGVVPDEIIERDRSMLLEFSDPTLLAARRWIETNEADTDEP